MHNVQEQFYMGKLGLMRISTDPLPLHDDTDLPWRIGRMQASGPIQEKGLEFFGAFEVDDNGAISSDDAALVALLVLRKPSGLCGPEGHSRTEILEWDSFGPRRLGRVLLRSAAAHIHPQDKVIADVVESNEDAIKLYERLGFTKGFLLPRDEDAIFDTQHIRYLTTGRDLRRVLGAGAVG
jgi:hypothetical protein